MRQFDTLLRQGLMDANLDQYERVLRQAGDEEPAFSPQYRRARRCLLEDPWGWERQPVRPVLRRGISRGMAAVIAALLLITAAAAVAVPLWSAFFGGLDQRQQALVDGMEITGGEEAEETAAESLLPPPAEHDGVTVTPLRLLGAKNRLYMVLEIRAAEGTVFRPEENYQLWGGLRLPPERRTEMAGTVGSFTVLEAGAQEPNVLVGVVEEEASFDIAGCTYRVRALYRRAPEGESETVFEAADSGAWDILIPEELNQDLVLEPPVEGMCLEDGRKKMTLLSMSVSPLGIWWKYCLEGDDPWPEVRMALRMKDGSEIQAAPGQLTMGDMGSGLTGSVSFEKPVDLSEAAAVLWGNVEIPLEPPERSPE